MKKMKGLLFAKESLKEGVVMKHFNVCFRRLFPILSAMFLVFVMIVGVYKIAYDRPFFKARLIAFEVDRIARILKEIDEHCNILAIRAEKNPIDFLTVRDFVSSEIGSLNLAYPLQWKGPYLRDNPTIRGRTFEIVKARDGVYVVPGQNVILPNGLIMGLDVVIDLNTNVSGMLGKNGSLTFKGVALAKKLDFAIGDWGYPESEKEKFEQLDEAFVEFGEALPYTESEVSLKENV